MDLFDEIGYNSYYTYCPKFCSERHKVMKIISKNPAKVGMEPARFLKFMCQLV